MKTKKDPKLYEAAKLFGGLITFENGDEAVDQMFEKGFKACVFMGLTTYEHMSAIAAFNNERDRAKILTDAIHNYLDVCTTAMGHSQEDFRAALKSYFEVGE